MKLTKVQNRFIKNKNMGFSLIKGKSLKAVFKADKGHLHHKLVAKGFSQKQAVLILYGISAAFGMFAVILFDSGILKALSFLLLVTVISAFLLLLAAIVTLVVSPLLSINLYISKPFTISLPSVEVYNEKVLYKPVTKITIKINIINITLRIPTLSTIS